MRIINKTVLKRVLEVSIATGIVLTTFSGCTTDLEQSIVIETQTEDPSMIKYDDIINYNYYIICIDDMSYEEDVYITRLPSYTSIDNLGNYEYEYYYREVDSTDIMGSVYYNRFTKEIRTRMGPDILYAISLEEYLNYYDVKKESYTKLEMMAIYNQVREDFSNNNFNDLKNKKVLIKDN